MFWGARLPWRRAHPLPVRAPPPPRISHTEASSQEVQPVSRPRRAGDEHSSPSTWEGGWDDPCGAAPWAQPLPPPPRAALQDQLGRGAKSGPFRGSPLAGEGAALRAHSSRWLGLGGGAPALLASDPPSCLPGSLARAGSAWSGVQRPKLSQGHLASDAEALAQASFESALPSVGISPWERTRCTTTHGQGCPLRHASGC